MANPLLNGIPQTPNFSGFKQLANMLKAAQNPDAALNMLAQKNPQFNNIIKMCNGRNPKEVFMEECQRRGIDPKEAIKQMGL